MSYTEFEARPIENVARGTIFALVAIPVGVALWVIIWSFGFIASIVGFAVAWLAVTLYRFGAGGVISRTGAVRVIAVTVITMLLAIFGGLVSDVAIGLGEAWQLSPVSVIFEPGFWDFFSLYINDFEVQKSLLPSVGIGLLFAAIGCFGTLRRALHVSGPGAAAATPAAVPMQPLFDTPPAQPGAPVAPSSTPGWGSTATPTPAGDWSDPRFSGEQQTPPAAVNPAPSVSPEPIDPDGERKP